MNTRQKIGIGVGAALAGIGSYFLVKGSFAANNQPVITKPVDLKRYLGDWYDIGHYPFSFQKKCHGSMAHYTLNDDGSIKVVNTCRIGSLSGPVKVAKGKARVIDKTTNAKLKVSFFWPFSGDYWVLDHADNYSWSIVGHPQRKYLWILSRVPRPDAATLSYILQRVQELGYDPKKIKWEDQPAEGMLHMDNEPVESEKIVAG